MEYKQAVKDAGLMLIIKDGLILSITRKEDPSLYGIIGGKCEPNETTKDAAIRETFEETSIIVKSCVMIFKRIVPPLQPGGLPFNSVCYFATDWEGTPQDSEEGKVTWLSEYELINPKTVPNGKGAFPDYNKNSLNSFKSMFPDIKLVSFDKLER